eukprot:2568686-Prorocentrum_lima.AAC.1
MTSSLVGSEMCIRDSSKTDVPSKLAKVAEALVKLLASAAVGRSMCAFAAVSYTHLTLPTICSV